jgi:hypothetical protein
MAIDRYSSCPGGSGKKIKFCCSDLVSDLDKVQRMIMGRQQVSCLELVNQLDAKYPNRACLLASKFSLEQGLGRRQASLQTLKRFLEHHPNNPIAQAELAVEKVQRGELLSGLQSLQRAVRASGNELPHQVYSAMGRLAELFLQAGHMLPARGLLLLQASINKANTDQAVQMLSRLTASPAVPVLFKDNVPFERPPADAPWAGDFNSALSLALRAQWQAAADLWTALSSTASDSPVLWKNLAIVRGYMGDYTNASYAYRRFAELATNEQDAIEAEATAQLLTKNATEGTADDLVVTYHLKDMAELERRLEASDRAEQVEIDPEDFVNEPPPKVIFALVDRPLVASGPQIAPDDVPQVIAEVLIFYADGDDPPRVELEVFRPQLTVAESLLREIGGDTLGERQDDEVIDRISAIELALSWRWRLPDDVTDEHRRKLLFDQRRRMVLEVWPKLPMPLFAGKSVEQAAGDQSMRTRLQAALLLLELEDTDPAADEICDELRRRLGVEPPPAIDPESIDVNALRLARFARLAAERLDDEQLTRVFHRAEAAGYESALRRFAQEVVRRGKLAGDIKLAAYQYLAQFEEDAEKAQGHLAEARRLAEKLRRPATPRDLELAARISGGRSPRPVGSRRGRR